MVKAPSLSFWGWFFGKDRPTAGWRIFVDRWLVLHLVIGIAMAYLVSISLKDAASTVLIPLAGVLVALSFAWVGNAQALLLSPEIESLSQFVSGGFEGYVYKFQAAILAILVTLVAWALAGFGVYDRQCFLDCPSQTYAVAKTLLFMISSLTVRECWHVVLGAQLLLRVQREIRNAAAKSSDAQAKKTVP